MQLRLLSLHTAVEAKIRHPRRPYSLGRRPVGATPWR
uniref:Uncharacterized protein n=1 Tax=Arundo donax TaxID=35708 RepID=A0A0A9B1M3_ARUDO